MSVNSQLLNCNSGCQLDRMKFLHEQQYLDMNDMLNNLQTEHLELCNYIEAYLVPYLEFHSRHGDDDAHELLIELNSFV